MGNLSDFVLGKYMGPPLGSLKSICHQIIRGVKHLHLLNTIHGDLKPTNILISIPKGDLDPLIKLSDFGLSHAVPTHSDCKKKLFLPAYTKGWMCPSDAVDKEGQRNSSFDIFPVALVFGFTVSKGVHAFGSNLEEAIERIEKQEPMTLTFAQIDASIRCPAFMDLLAKMLNYDATKRPTATDILNHNFFLQKQTANLSLISTPHLPSGEVRAKRIRLIVPAESQSPAVIALSNKDPIQQATQELLDEMEIR